MKLSLADAAATEALGAAIANAFGNRAGVVIYLRGNLGAGKTTLARGLLRSLGVTGTIRSPTYTLLEHYRNAGRNVLHLDLYRLTDPLELTNLGLSDFPSSENWWLIEWPERGGALLPAADLELQLSVCDAGRAASMRFASESEAAALLGVVEGATSSVSNNLLKE